MEELLQILTDMHPDVDFETEEHLIDDAVLDSLDIVGLITEISENFDVTITARTNNPRSWSLPHMSFWAFSPFFCSCTT